MLRKNFWMVLVASLLVIIMVSTTVACSQSSSSTATQPAQTSTQATSGSSSGAQINWRLNTTVPAKHYQYIALQWLADQVSQQTNGNFKITVYPQGALPFKQDQALVNVENGDLEAGHMLGASVAGTDPDMDMLSLPGVYPSDLSAKRAICDYIYPDYKKVIESNHKVILYSIMLQSARNLYVKKPVNDIADLKGMKIRSAGGMEADFTNKLGATAVSLDAPELYQALQTGLIDGYWLVDTGTTLFKLNEVVKYIINISSGESGNFVLINKAAFDKLPQNYQKILMDLQPAYQKKLGDGMISSMSAARKVLLDEGMTQINWTAANLKPLEALYKPYTDAWLAKASPDAKALFEKTESYIQKQGWK